MDWTRSPETAIKMRAMA